VQLWEQQAPPVGSPAVHQATSPQVHLQNVAPVATSGVLLPSVVVPPRKW